jgi:predicted  nucleic acid-binding Zn-ribbon protein
MQKRNQKRKRELMKIKTKEEITRIDKELDDLKKRLFAFENCIFHMSDLVEKNRDYFDNLKNHEIRLLELQNEILRLKSKIQV